MGKFVPFAVRHGSPPIPAIPPVMLPVVDVNDRDAWPEINAAIDHARMMRGIRKDA